MALPDSWMMCSGRQAEVSARYETTSRLCDPRSQWGPWVGQWSWYSQGLRWCLWSVLPPKYMRALPTMLTPDDAMDSEADGADPRRKLASRLPCLWNRWQHINWREELVLPFSIPQHWGEGGGQGCGCQRAVSHHHRALLSWWFLALMPAERLSVLGGLAH